MSIAATTADPPSQPGPGRFAPVLSLIRKLIDYGAQLAAAFRQPNPNTDLEQIARGFGTHDVSHILARIVRGLQRAAMLEAKLIRLDALPEPLPKAPARLRQPEEPSTRRGPSPATPAHLLTPSQIAVQVRSGTIGATIANICRDLGILPCHPLWRELRQAIVKYEGNVTRLIREILNRPWLNLAAHQPLTTTDAPEPAPAATGPPPRSK